VPHNSVIHDFITLLTPNEEYKPRTAIFHFFKNADLRKQWLSYQVVLVSFKANVT
jgi:hypothetical protein